MHRLLFFILIFVLGLPKVQAQEEALAAQLENLARVGRQILEHPEYTRRDSAQQWFKRELQALLATEEGYLADFSGVTNMMSLEADQFRLFTWQIPDQNYQYTRHGMVAVRTRRGPVVTPLIDKGPELAEPEFKRLRPEQWLGAIYYELIPVKEKRQTHYTLLGYASGADIHQKIVDIIEVRPNGKVRFGDKQFYLESFNDQLFRKPPMRLIMRYSAQYSATMRWRPKEKMIIMDHVTPPQPRLEGAYHTYGPDFSYLGLYWKDGWWHLDENPQFDTELNRPIVPPRRPLGLPPR